MQKLPEDQSWEFILGTSTNLIYIYIYLDKFSWKHFILKAKQKACNIWDLHTKDVILDEVAYDSVKRYSECHYDCKIIGIQDKAVFM